MADANQLYGSCACERNQYTVIIPRASVSLAQVFFDNSAANRRQLASPVTAWLRIPLDWYHSTTFALFPDETHHSIRRTFNTPSVQSAMPPTRRQFCGYCGTHLTAWNEGYNDSADYLDVTLGSLMSDSIERLEDLKIIPDAEDDEEGLVKGGTIDDEDHIPMKEDDEEGLVKGGTIDDEDHIPTNEEEMSGVEGAAAAFSNEPPATGDQNTLAVHRMRNRGMPYFEEMVENSRLGRIKRQKGGHTSHDGTTSVQWEVVEIDGSDPSPVETASETTDGGGRSKRQKTSA